LLQLSVQRQLRNALAGQNGALISALLVAGTLVTERSPVAGGVMMGLLAVKPQFGILLPVCLIARRSWRAIITATATVGTLTTLSGLIFGWQAWVLFASRVTPFMTQQILDQAYDYHHGYQFMMATPFILARWSGAGLPECYAFQAVATGVAAFVAWRVWRIPHADPLMRMASTVCLTVLATPYAFTYDMIAIAVAAAVIAQAGWRDGFLPGELCLTVLVWLWPGCAIFLGVAGLPPCGSILIAGLATCAWLRLDRLPRLTPRFQPVGAVFDQSDPP
jgi:alpha-1,2-mannosyltransferase